MNTQYNYIKVAFKNCWIAAIIVAISFTSCKKAIDIGQPKTLINSANVYGSNATAEGVVAGLFLNFAAANNMYNGSSSVTVQQGLAADELKSYLTSGTGNTMFYTNALNNQNAYYWTEIFYELFICNSAIEGLNSSSASSLTPSIRQQLLGEVKFARGFIFFNAVNLYGDVPLVLSTDRNTNNTISRSPAATVLKQVVKDLTDAQALLPDNSYVNFAGASDPSRLLPNKQTASALLARVYLYTQDWKNAETQSASVIAASSYALEPVLTNVFLRASRETIWQLQPVNVTAANADAGVLIMNGAPTGLVNNFALSDSLYNAFENGDQRLINWVGTLQSGTETYHFAYKYKQSGAIATVNEYPIMFRLAEQYLIRAEARAQQNNMAGAQSDLNAIRTRAGLSNTTATSQTALLNAIYRERRIELFLEFGHRWFDLKRTGSLDAVMNIFSPQKGGIWSSYKALIPIPASEININAHLIQNPGY